MVTASGRGRTAPRFGTLDQEREPVLCREGRTTGRAATHEPTEFLAPARAVIANLALLKEAAGK
jgi:hypothetical protein